MSELAELQQNYLLRMQEEKDRELQENALLIQKFIQFAKTKNLVLTQDNFDYIQTIGIVAIFPNIVNYLCPDIRQDKEGLVDFKFLLTQFENRFGGYLYSNNFVLLAHPYFRREFYANNNFAPRFTDIFWKFDHTNLNSSIAIDFNRIRINVDNRMYIERDTWYGAKFSKQISQIPDGIVKLRPPADMINNDFVIDFCFANAHSLDIKWETKNSIKTFQAEEFKTNKVKILKDGKTFFPVKYIHAEFDLDKNIFRHFDGAVHLYTEAEYYKRRDSDFNYNKKNDIHIKSNSEKLFKFNGEISVDTWIEFSSHFFTRDSDFIKYIEGEYPDNVLDFLNAMRNK